MARIYDLVTSNALASYWNVASQYRTPYFGESKFPNKKKLGMKLEFVKGAKNAPVMLMPSALDAKVIPISRQGFEVNTEKMPFFKNSMLVNEEDRQALNMISEGNNAAVKTIVDRIYDDEMTLLENAALTREIMRMQALTTGAVTIAANGQNLSYDYGVPAENKVTPSVKWSVAETSDPIADINAWKLQISATKGVEVEEGLLNSVTLSYLQKSAAVKALVYANVANAPASVSASRLLQFLKEETGITFYVYDKGWDNNGVFTKFVADGTVVLMPETDLGNTWFGTTPEESDLMGGVGTKASVSIVDTGVAVATYKEEDPVTVVTKVSEIVLPSFEMADQVIIASVK
jgi:hypothetical protein